VEHLQALGIAREDVSTLLRENPPENRGLNGGHSANDYDPGFTIEVLARR
jgi:hypothetical protein